MIRPKQFQFVFCLSLVSVASVIQSSGLHADEDRIVVELAKAKEEYTAKVEKANELLLTAFTDQHRKLESNKKLKVDEQIDLLERLQKERTAFEADASKLPLSPVMAIAANDYRTRLATASKKCEAAFDKAAKACRDKKDVTAAKAVLDEKLAFLGIPLIGKFTMVSDPPSVKSFVEFFPNGTFTLHNTGKDKGTWTQKKTTVELTFENKAYGTATVSATSVDEMTGLNTHASGSVWKWTLTRTR